MRQFRNKIYSIPTVSNISLGCGDMLEPNNRSFSIPRAHFLTEDATHKQMATRTDKPMKKT